MQSTDFYRQILGIEAPWKIVSVELNMEAKRVVIRAEVERKTKWGHPQTKCPASLHKWTERSWRHLDTCQFETFITANVPSVKHEDGSIEEIAVPWAGRYKRVTKLLAQAVIMWLEACGNVAKVASIMKLDWQTVNNIMRAAVERGLLRREDELIEHVGIDEKSFRRGHVYASILNDLDHNRVWDLVEGRKTQNARELLDTLSKQQKSGVKAVAMDMWAAFEKAVHETLPNADIVHDKFHISSYLNKAVDDVRKEEHRLLMKEGDESLKNSKYQWMRNFPDLRCERSFQSLYNANLKTSKAWRLKESFAGFWDYRYEGAAKKFFEDWYKQVRRSRLEPMKKVAQMLENRLQGLLNYIKHRITNAASEGMNSLVARIIANARGLRSFAQLRIRVLFFLGKLNLSIA
ncbi:ISL3 family transposase [soil metagenome]